jgi:hypothetical protein
MDVIIETLEGLGLAVSADDAGVTSFSCQGSVANSIVGRLTTVFGALAPFVTAGSEVYYDDNEEGYLAFVLRFRDGAMKRVDAVVTYPE